MRFELLFAQRFNSTNISWAPGNECLFIRAFFIDEGKYCIVMQFFEFIISMKKLDKNNMNKATHLCFVILTMIIVIKVTTSSTTKLKQISEVTIRSSNYYKLQYKQTILCDCCWDHLIRCADSALTNLTLYTTSNKWKGTADDYSCNFSTRYLFSYL